MYINYRVSDYLKKEGIILRLTPRPKIEIIKEMVSRIPDITEKKSKKIIEKIMKREQLESTGIGNGIAIPHARTEEVDELTVLFAHSKEGVNFKALDGKPVYLIFLILSRERDKNLYIKVLARLSRLLKQQRFREALMAVKNEDEVIKIIQDYEII